MRSVERIGLGEGSGQWSVSPLELGERIDASLERGLEIGSCDVSGGQALARALVVSVSDSKASISGASPRRYGCSSS